MSKLYAFDLETHLIQPGLQWPPIVVGSVADEDSARLIPREDLYSTFVKLLQEQIGGQNIFYDLGCMGATWPEFVEPIFQAIEEGRIIDSKVLEQLHDNAEGHLGHEPGQPNTPRGYSLSDLAQRHLGVDLTAEKKNPSAWRYRYWELEGKPIDTWPEEARAYPVRDARFTYDVIAKQSAPGRQNVEQYASEIRAGWFLALASGWGMRTDEQLTPYVVGEITRKHDESRRKFMDAGIVRVRKCTKKKDKNTGLSEYEKADDISVKDLEEAIERLRALPSGEGLFFEQIPGSGDLVQRGHNQWVPGRIIELQKLLPDARAGFPIRFAEDKGRLKGLVTEAYLGDPPMTSGGEKGEPQVSTSRDTLAESGDDLLEDYADAGANEKLYSTFVKVLEQGTKVPINPRANVMVATDRTSYAEPNLQQIPQVGMIRECFVPRGYIYEGEK